MKKILSWIKQNNKDMGIVYMLHIFPAYFIGCVVIPVVVAVAIGYGAFKLVSIIFQ